MSSTTSPSRLFHLPSELWDRVFDLGLHARDLLNYSLVSKYSRSLIRNSSLAQYHIALYLNHLVPSQGSRDLGLTPYHFLVEHQQAWRSATFRYRYEQRVGELNDTALSHGKLVWRRKEPKFLATISIPNRGPRTRDTDSPVDVLASDDHAFPRKRALGQECVKHIAFDYTPLFHIVDASQNLLVTTQLLESPRRVRLHFLTLSTNMPHPWAHKDHVDILLDDIDVSDVFNSLRAIEMRIFGSSFAFLWLCREISVRQKILFWNWENEIPQPKSQAIIGPIQGFTFLSRTVLLISTTGLSTVPRLTILDLCHLPTPHRELDPFRDAAVTLTLPNQLQYLLLVDVTLSATTAPAADEENRVSLNEDPPPYDTTTNPEPDPDSEPSQSTPTSTPNTPPSPQPQPSTTTPSMRLAPHRDEHPKTFTSDPADQLILITVRTGHDTAQSQNKSTAILVPHSSLWALYAQRERRVFYGWDAWKKHVVTFSLDRRPMRRAGTEASPCMALALHGMRVLLTYEGGAVAVVYDFCRARVRRVAHMQAMQDAFDNEETDYLPHLSADYTWGLVDYMMGLPKNPLVAQPWTVGRGGGGGGGGGGGSGEGEGEEEEDRSEYLEELAYFPPSELGAEPDGHDTHDRVELEQAFGKSRLPCLGTIVVSPDVVGVENVWMNEDCIVLAKKKSIVILTV